MNSCLKFGFDSHHWQCLHFERLRSWRRVCVYPRKHSCSHRASPILLAIGVPRDIAKNAVRLSVGRETTREDIDLVIKDLQKAVESLQKKPKKA